MIVNNIEEACEWYRRGLPVILEGHTLEQTKFLVGVKNHIEVTGSE